MPDNIIPTLERLQALNKTKFIEVSDFNKTNYTSIDRTPFVYYIKWSTNNIHYIGSRYGKNVLPHSLMTTYFTSSTKVKKYMQTYGLPDVVIILKTFKNEIDTREYESILLKTFNASKNRYFLNCSNGNKNFNCTAWSSESRTKASVTHKNLPKILCKHCNKEFKVTNYSRYHGDKCSMFTGIANKGFPHTDKTIQKISEIIKNLPKILCKHCNKEFSKLNYKQFHGDNCSVFTGEKIKKPLHSNATKNKMRLNALNRPKILCEHCNKMIDKGNYAQSHGDKCKLRVIVFQTPS